MGIATEPIAPGVWRSEEPGVDPMFRAAMVTVIGRDADLQFDFGCGLGPLRPALPLSGAPVIAVASHAHVDHIGGFHEFADRRGHAAEAAAFAGQDPDATFAGEFAAWPGGAAPGQDLSAWRLVPAPLTLALSDGDRIDLGDRVLSVLHLPGHSPGGIGLLDEAAGLLLSGDAIYDDEILDDIPGADRTAYAATMERLRHLDCRMVIGGHGPPMTRARMVALAEAWLGARAP
ncbi:MAG: MBL fold metallo-hydrolase [Fuscovulum sp.]|jgi:glyoxylase-like metal-dependent hydrolase (beta-lactamase superfamily II)|nr:MBL fold metallo-hydrolase [Fuscovulum sp.]